MTRRTRPWRHGRRSRHRRHKARTSDRWAWFIASRTVLIHLPGLAIRSAYRANYLETPGTIEVLRQPSPGLGYGAADQGFEGGVGARERGPRE